MEAAYAFFYDRRNDLEVVHHYADRREMENDFDRINYDCAKYGIQDYEAIEIDKQTAMGFVNSGMTYIEHN